MTLAVRENPNKKEKNLSQMNRGRVDEFTLSPRTENTRVSTVDDIQARSSLFGLSKKKGKLHTTTEMTQSNSIEGIKDYICPRGELARLPIPTTSSMKDKQKRISFIDQYVAAKKVVMSPDKYVQNFVWCDKKEDGVCRPKG